MLARLGALIKQAELAGSSQAIDEFSKLAIDYKRLANMLDTVGATAPKPPRPPKPKGKGKGKGKSNQKPKPDPNKPDPNKPDPAPAQPKIEDLLPTLTPNLQSILHPGISLPAAFGSGMVLTNLLAHRNEE